MESVVRAENRPVVVTEAEIDVLDVGAGDGTTCRGLFPKAKITRLDIFPVTGPDVVADIAEGLPLDLHLSFDIVLASHVLEHIDRRRVVGAIKNIRSALRYGGLAYLVVPSLEWCARELLRDRPSDAVLPMIYGEPDTPHEAHVMGFTLMMLRHVTGMAGLHVRDAYQTGFTIRLRSSDGKQRELAATQNVVVAMRAEDDQEEPNGHGS
jgi:SAM-dependent methyltransferase